MNLEEKAEEACREIPGFKTWLEEARGSRVFSNMQRGIKRNIIALDYDKLNGLAALVLEEPGNKVPERQINSGVSETALYQGINPREVQIYGPKEGTYKFVYGTEERMNKILDTAVKIGIALKGFQRSKTCAPDAITFGLCGIDSAGKTLVGEFYYIEKLEPLDC